MKNFFIIFSICLFFTFLKVSKATENEKIGDSQGLFIKYTYVSGYVLTEDGDTLKEAKITVVYEKRRRIIGTYETDPITGRYGFNLRRKRKYHLSIVIEGYFPHSEYILTNKYKEELHKDIVIPNSLSKVYQVRFDENSYRLNDKAKEILKRLSVDLQFSSTYVVELDYNQREKLIKKRKQSIRKYLVADGINDNRIIDPNKYSSDEDPYFILRINDGDSPYDDELADDDGLDFEIEDGEDIVIHDGSDGTEGGGGIIIQGGGCETVEVEYIFFEDNEDENYNGNAVHNINKVAEYLLNHPTTILEIIGFADGRGGEEYNKDLGIRRAIFVKNELMKKGVPELNLLISSYGEGSPIANNDMGIDVQSYNRRAEFRIFEQTGDAQPLLVKQPYLASDEEVKRWRNKPSASRNGYSPK